MMDQLEFGFDAPGEAASTPRTPAPAPLQRAAVAPTVEPSAAETFHAALLARTGIPIQLHINDNRSTVMSVKYDRFGRSARVGLHHMFVLADDAVLDALAHWIKHPRSRKHAALLNGFIKANNALIKARKPRAQTLDTRGDFFDLRELFDEVNAAHFDGRVDAGITWGRMPAKARRRSIRFGSYSPQEHLIRMHPLLDAEGIPRFFVRYIVFHEMLHADLGIEEGEGRRVIHSREFRQRERAYPEFAQAEAWMAKPANLARLLGRAPRARR